MFSWPLLDLSNMSRGLEWGRRFLRGLVGLAGILINLSVCLFLLLFTYTVFSLTCSSFFLSQVDDGRVSTEWGERLLYLR